MRNAEAFSEAILRLSLTHGDLDGAEIQELGLKSGLLREVEMPGPCSSSCVCGELGDFPVRCYRFTCRSCCGSGDGYDQLCPSCKGKGHL